MHKMYCKEEDITHGQRYLLTLMETRELTSFWKDFKDEYSFEYFFYAAIGKFKTPSYRFIFELREKINPVLWFFRESENVPETALKKGIVYFTDSINFKKLKSLYEHNLLWKFFVIDNHSKPLYQSTVSIITENSIVNCNYIKRLDSKFHDEFPIENWFVSD